MKEKIIKELKKNLPISEKEISSLLEIPPSRELGDYAFPTFSLANILKKNPQEIASQLSKKISLPKEIEKIETKGPYLNFFVNKKYLAETTLNKILKEKDKYGSSKEGKEKVLIESPGPNTNKPLHVGHARNVILAQSIKEISKFLGNNVKIVGIFNDRGVHICKSMLAYDKFGKNLTPEKAKKKPDHFVGDFYVKYAQESKIHPEMEDEVKEYLRKWETGDKKVISLWKKMNSWALKGIKETYKKFNLKIDKDYYESKIYKLGKEIVNEQLKKGKVQKKLDGALFADLSKKGLGEKILIRSDGTSIYITQDLHIAIARKKEYDFDKMIYVVANEQEHHFKTLFALLERFDYNWARSLFHLSYGLVHLESGRLKSREGNVVDADNLIEDLQNLAQKEVESRYKDLPQKEKVKRANAIAMAALRYYFLKVDRLKEMIFKPEESISFEGNTGPYLLYTYARAKSILRKAGKKLKAKFSIENFSPLEKSIVIQLAKFPETVQQAHNQLAPNLIANYAHGLAQIFNEFYHYEKVIGSESENFRLLLVDAFSQVLKNALRLLNIQTLEIM